MQVSATHDRHLVFIRDQGKQFSFKIVAFDISDKGVAVPICYPNPPKDARCFAVEHDGYRPFDLASGLTTGPGQTKPE